MANSKADQLRALYQRVPAIDCKRLCQECCGPIGTSREERRLIVRRAGVGPKVTPDLTCNLLVAGACSVYQLRPMICRLWGVTVGMECPHGCVPERLLSEQEAADLLQESIRIGGKDDHWKKEVPMVAAFLRKEDV